MIIKFAKKVFLYIEHAKQGEGHVAYGEICKELDGLNKASDKRGRLLAAWFNYQIQDVSKKVEKKIQGYQYAGDKTTLSNAELLKQYIDDRNSFSDGEPNLLDLEAMRLLLLLALSPSPSVTITPAYVNSCISNLFSHLPLSNKLAQMMQEQDDANEHYEYYIEALKNFFCYFAQTKGQTFSVTWGKDVYSCQINMNFLSEENASQYAVAILQRILFLTLEESKPYFQSGNFNTMLVKLCNALVNGKDKLSESLSLKDIYEKLQLPENKILNQQVCIYVAAYVRLAKESYHSIFSNSICSVLKDALETNRAQYLTYLKCLFSNQRVEWEIKLNTLQQTTLNNNLGSIFSVEQQKDYSDIIAGVYSLAHHDKFSIIIQDQSLYFNQRLVVMVATAPARDRSSHDGVRFTSIAEAKDVSKEAETHRMRGSIIKKIIKDTMQNANFDLQERHQFLLGVLSELNKSVDILSYIFDAEFLKEIQGWFIHFNQELVKVLVNAGGAPHNIQDFITATINNQQFSMLDRCRFLLEMLKIKDIMSNLTFKNSIMGVFNELLLKYFQQSEEGKEKSKEEMHLLRDSAPLLYAYEPVAQALTLVEYHLTYHGIDEDDGKLYTKIADALRIAKIAKLPTSKYGMLSKLANALLNKQISRDQFREIAAGLNLEALESLPYRFNPDPYRYAKYLCKLAVKLKATDAVTSCIFGYLAAKDNEFIEVVWEKFKGLSQDELSKASSQAFVEIFYFKPQQYNNAVSTIACLLFYLIETKKLSAKKGYNLSSEFAAAYQAAEKSIGNNIAQYKKLANDGDYKSAFVMFGVTEVIDKMNKDNEWSRLETAAKVAATSAPIPASNAAIPLTNSGSHASGVATPMVNNWNADSMVTTPEGLGSTPYPISNTLFSYPTFLFANTPAKSTNNSLGAQSESKDQIIERLTKELALAQQRIAVLEQENIELRSRQPEPVPSAPPFEPVDSDCPAGSMAHRR